MPRKNKTCIICRGSFYNFRKHLKNDHDLNYRQYNDLYSFESISCCEMCSIETNWDFSRNKYNKYCSSCKGIGRRKTQINNGWKLDKEKHKIGIDKFWNSDKGKLRKNILSQEKKNLFKDKLNHPMFGKHHSKESIEKNRLSNIATTKRMIENGIVIERKSCFESGNYKGFHYRSSYEKHFLKLLFLVEDITFTYESLIIPYVHDNLEKIYIPDYIIKHDNKTFVVEIKPLKLSKTKVNISKFKYAEKYCKENEYEFIVLTEGTYNKFIFSKFNKFNPIFINKLMGSIK